MNALSDIQAAISAKNVGITTRTSGAISPACVACVPGVAVPARAVGASAACPACHFPIRRIYAGELICPNCGKREVLCREFWRRIEAAMVIRVGRGENESVTA